MRELATPSPAAGQVRVRVHATSLNRADWYVLRGSPFPARIEAGLWRPRRDFVPGLDMAGVVEAVGPGVSRLAVGDRVCGEVKGAFADRVCAPEDALASVPASVDLESAAALPVAGMAALQGLAEQARVQPGQRVLINGASGGVGTFAIQIAKALGAEVTGVCSTRNVEQARALGADHVVSYEREDFTATRERYDLIFELAGSRPFGRVRRLLLPTGVLVSSTSNLRYLLRSAVASLFSRRVVVLVARPTRARLERLLAMVEVGAVRPAIERCYAFEELPQALRHHGRGHVRGKAVVRVGPA